MGNRVVSSWQTQLVIWCDQRPSGNNTWLASVVSNRYFDATDCMAIHVVSSSKWLCTWMAMCTVYSHFVRFMVKVRDVVSVSIRD